MRGLYCTPSWPCLLKTIHESIMNRPINWLIYKAYIKHQVLLYKVRCWLKNDRWNAEPIERRSNGLKSNVKKLNISKFVYFSNFIHGFSFPNINDIIRNYVKLYYTRNHILWHTFNYTHTIFSIFLLFFINCSKLYIMTLKSIQ